jgi:uncharacterized membrane protein
MAHGIVLLGLGAGIMYLMDPQSGRKRRADLKNQVDSTARKLQHGKEQVVRDAQNRARGLSVEGRRLAHTAIDPWRKTHWSPAQRAVAGGFGASLATYGYFRGGLKGWLLAALGGTLLARSVANEELRSIARKDIHIEKTQRIDAPVEQVYAYWRNLENFPQWMSHVQEVRYIGGDRYHWTVDGPAGKPVEWDSELLNVVENREMTWRSVEGSMVQHTGRVRFEPDGAGTRVHVQLRYTPPGGLIGHMVAKAFGVDPKSEMDDDLNRLKSLVETGRVPHGTAAARRLGESGAAGLAAS